MGVLSASQYLLAFSFKKWIANLIGEKLDLIVVLICTTLIICNCGLFLCLLMGTTDHIPAFFLLLVFLEGPKGLPDL